MLTIELLELLRTPNGAELLRLAAEREADPFAAERLRPVAARLFPGGLAGPLAAAAVEQARLRRKAAAKFSRASEMWFTRPLLEQASGEIVSRHRARRFAGREEAGDFCCGLGGDAVALAAHVSVLAVDRDPLALALTRANAEVHGVAERVRTLHAEVPGGAPDVPAAWVDPGRREGGRRTRRLDALSPAFGELLELQSRILHLGIKLSPATADHELDSWLGERPHEREFLSVEGECRELALWFGSLIRPVEGVTPVVRRATLLPAGAELAGEPQPAGPARLPGRYLLEPDAAVIRAGLVGNLAVQLGAWPIDPRLAYLSADRPVETPFARLYRIEPPIPFSARALAGRLREIGAGDVVFKTRGAAVEPEQLRQRLRGVLKQGRPECRPVVFVTRLGGRAVMILGERVERRGDQ